MYFFRSVILIFIIIVASFMIYQYLSNKSTLNLGKKKILFIFLGLIQGLLILFNNHFLFFIFLDFSCFLGYQIKLRKEAFLLSLVNILFLTFTLEIPVYFYLVYFVYLFLDYLLANNHKNTIDYLITIKAFITSYVYFLYFNQSSIGILYLVFYLLYFVLLLKLGYSFLKSYEEKKNDNNLIFQIAHEVKNPIAVCKGYLDMLDTTKKDKVNKYIPIVRSEMNRALTIMDDFLNLKRLTVNKDIMDLSLLLEDVSATMNSILSSKDIILDISDTSDEIIIEGDYDRLKQVFINLVKNAYEANAKKIKIITNIKKDIVEVVISDDGDGINSKDLKKIGDLFYTTKTKGTGIGVSMSKEIIKLHDGKMKYDSKIGEGTDVNLTLPYKFIF